jgi:hypothetical protein
MAELTNLEEKLAEVVGLAMAAQVATEKVLKLTDSPDATSALEQMNREASETEERGTTLVDTMEGRKTAILEEARSTKSKAADMLSTYLDDNADDLDGFEFLTMAEAGEVGHWKVLSEMAQRAGNNEVLDLARWALPIQERHFDDVQKLSLELASQEDPREPA